MNDLLLWRLLRRDPIDPAEIIPLLGPIAGAAFRHRIPFLAALERLLTHADPAVRCEALRAFSGAGGYGALRAIVARLDDERPDVRLAAVEALRAAAHARPARFAHAIFHADPAVRAAALSGPTAPANEWLDLYLLSDPALRDTVLGRIGGDAERPLTVAPHATPVVLEFFKKGVLDREQARRLLGPIPWNQLSQYLVVAGRRRGAPHEIVAAAANPKTIHKLGSPFGSDVLDEMLDLFWDDAESSDRSAPDETQQFFRQLVEATLPASPFRVRVAASCLFLAAHRGNWSDDAGVLCAITAPTFLRAAWVPRELRVRSACVLYNLGARLVKIADDECKALIDSDLCHRDDGSLDLRAVGAAMQYVQNNATERTVAWLGADAIVESVLDDPVNAAPFFGVLEDSKHGRSWLLKRIQAAEPGRFGTLLAAIVRAASPTGLGFLSALDATSSLHVAMALSIPPPPRGAPIAPRIAEIAGQVLAVRMGEKERLRFLVTWFDQPHAEEHPFALAVLNALGASMSAAEFVRLAAGLPRHALRTLLEVLPKAPSITYATERALAEKFGGHVDRDIASWALARQLSDSAPVERAVATPGGREVPTSLVRELARCKDADLPTVLMPCLLVPSKGLVAALRRRASPGSPSLEVCLALLACHDPMDEVATQFERFGSDDTAFLTALDAAMVKRWVSESELPPLGHAWLHRWERHTLVLIERFTAAYGSLSGALRGSVRLGSRVLRREVWDGIADAVAILRWRDPPRLRAVVDDGVVRALVEALGTSVGDPAANVLRTLYDARDFAPALEAHRAAASERIADASDAARTALRPWVESTGLLPAAPRMPVASETDDDTLVRIRNERDLDALEKFARAPNMRIAQEAALRLIELGARAVARLATVVCSDEAPPAIRYLIESIPLWPAGDALARVRDRMLDAKVATEMRFRLACAMIERGEKDHVGLALSMANAETREPWFRPEDWDRLRGLGLGDRALALSLAASPQPHAYSRAVPWLLAQRDPDGDVIAALGAFLEGGVHRMGTLRREVAWFFHRRGDGRGFPILLASAIEDPEARRDLLAGVEGGLVIDATASILLAGPRQVAEDVALDLLRGTLVEPIARGVALDRILDEALTTKTRGAAVKLVDRTHSRGIKLRRVAQTFAWGKRIAHELTGRVFTIDMITSSALGYTRLNENRIHVSPLPILRGDRDGREVVEALILHELGHQMYHRGEDGMAAWKQAQTEGIHGLFNLVADEHLERNLRALDESFGDRLKTLVSYAFQHTAREVGLGPLLGALQDHAFEVLTATRLGVARQDGCVVVSNGRLLQTMERRKLAFARFMRALRMGLGNRHHDKLVDQGLALFRGNFRKKTMPELLDVARKLRDIFGWQVEMLETFGPHESLGDGGSEETIHGDGISNDDIQREVERIANPRKRRSDSAGGGGGGRPWINVNESERFDEITRVVAVPHDPPSHHVLSREVARHARAMQRYLHELGLTREPTRFRIQGRRFDTTRTRAVVLRGDPRMLLRREPRIKNDLFIGMAIDCSGSMQSRNNMHKARMFATLLADAARDIPGIDVRIFGFTDQVIYDAGDARRPAAHALIANGGNNDAGALWHVAQVALASRRKSKLLVMISDGLPTECSVAALKGLVSRLRREFKMCCAQVAVQPIPEVCFPNYVVLSDEDPNASVRKFGGVIAKLVRKTLSSG